MAISKYDILNAMKICGIICELNPAHNGHKYIFDKAREAGADKIIAIMSGDYVQRGEPALFDKHIRTKMALTLGADVCIELPGMFATGSAQYFARGAVSILNTLGADSICFGSECGDIDLLSSQEFTTPNDVLASEYIKAIKYFKSSITPYAIKRIGTDYNDSVSTNDNICSASYIRANSDTMDDSFKAFMPESTYQVYISATKEYHKVSFDDISSQLFYKLNAEMQYGYSQYFDVFDDLSEKIIKNLGAFTTADEFSHVLKSKDIAFSHIKRALLHILLNITKEDVESAISNNYISYIRLLGFKSASSDILSEIKKASATPIISKLADAHNLLDDYGLAMLEKDIANSHLYSLISSGHIINEYSRQLIIQ